MFTGIVEEIGTISNINKNNESTSIEVKAHTVIEGTKPGDSIAVNGICLTVTSVSDSHFTADVMNETIKRSSLGSIKAGNAVNLERAMSAIGRFGGHMVSGHIDGIGKIDEIREDGNAQLFTVSAPPKIMKYIIEKGSVALDGISLTVADLTATSFRVSVIPHTMTNTCLLQKKEKDIINIENDCIGKYVEKLLHNDENVKNDNEITESFLIQNGF